MLQANFHSKSYFLNEKIMQVLQRSKMRDFSLIRKKFREFGEQQKNLPAIFSPTHKVHKGIYSCPKIGVIIWELRLLKICLFTGEPSSMLAPAVCWNLKKSETVKALYRNKATTGCWFGGK